MSRRMTPVDLYLDLLKRVLTRIVIEDGNLVYTPPAGSTAEALMNVLRMEKAIEGLTQSRQRLVSLSDSLGFSAQSHFTRFFQQHLGAMPSQYRMVADVYDHL